MAKPKSSKKSSIGIIFIVIILVLSLCLCSLLITAGVVYWLYTRDDGGDIVPPDLTDLTSNSMEKFESKSAFNEYTDKVAEEYSGKYEDDFAMSETSFGLGDVTAPTSEGDLGEAESITNVQEVGVDEGDIVKAYQDYLIILSRGRLYTVKMDDETLTPIFSINAYPEGFTGGTWYDEMLIYEDTIIVIGYSYNLSATEIELFSIDNDGEIIHQDTYFIDSNDYYSSRNYASRLKDDKLILYMPYYLFTWDYSGDTSERKLSLPQIREWKKDNTLTSGTDLLDGTDIYKPVQETYDPTLHTVLTCDLDKGFDCTATGILGPYSRNFYVSNNAIYLWVTEPYFWWYEEDDYQLIEKEGDAYVYRIPLDNQSAQVLRADGSPIDQFSFKEMDDNLYVLVSEYQSGDAMWNPEYNESDVLALLTIPLDEFSDEPNLIHADYFTALPRPDGYTLVNRFVDKYLLYGAGSTWYNDETSENVLYIKPLLSAYQPAQVTLSHSVDRIEALGDNAVIVGSDDENLKFSSIELFKTRDLVDTYIIRNASQGELRSHGFYYYEFPDSTGILGLPIRQGESYDHLFDQSAEILFLHVNDDLELSDLGSLEAEEIADEEYDDCEVSCVDWYGNSRPIFYNDRIFALLGYELVEGEFDGTEINEIDRVNIYRRTNR